MSEMVLLGDEALAMGAVHAGLSAAYGYPGTPSTEIIEFLLRLNEGRKKAASSGAEAPFIAAWCANEKTAYEDALGASMVGRRALVTMKHVGLNVASDPFVNSALLDIGGGLVLAVADDPGMHSSQDEQDSRFYADFAKVPCLEPRSQQECYDMAIEAFELSERLRVPVVLRITTRLAHSRAVVQTGEGRAQNPVRKTRNTKGWMLLPATARANWKKLLGKQEDFARISEGSGRNALRNGDGKAPFAVLTAGLGGNYYLESAGELPFVPDQLHVSFYPLPEAMIRKLAEGARKILVIEEGYPFIEAKLRGILPQPVAIEGKLSGALPLEGELTPDLVRAALGLPAREAAAKPPADLPGRPPQLCQGCPHDDSYRALKEALADYPESLVTSDIGCYALGALPPLAVPESIVCMGASVGMAKGAAEAGFGPVVAVLGDSTFLHSGLPSLLDCVDADASVTVMILDNYAVGMTGGQKTIMPRNRLAQAVIGLGADPAHVKVIEAHRNKHAENVGILRAEIAHEGLSVVIAVRECVETAKRKAKAGCEE